MSIDALLKIIASYKLNMKIKIRESKCYGHVPKEILFQTPLPHLKSQKCLKGYKIKENVHRTTTRFY